MFDVHAASSVAALWAGFAAGAVVLLFGSTYLLTTLRFLTERERFNNPEPGESLQPPQIPYSTPWLGSARQFLNKTPHKFWRDLLAWYGRDGGACAIVMGGEHSTLIFNKASINYVLKDRKMGRDNFNEMAARYAFSLPDREIDKFYAHGIAAKPGEVHARKQEELINLEYLLKAEKVNELTAEFARTLQRDIADMFTDRPGEISLFTCLRSLMFTASTTALWGEKVLEMIPNFEETFFRFDADILSLFFRLPKWMIPKAFSNRDRAIEQLMRWHAAVEQELGETIPDPETVAWEPLFGSRVNRARHLFYRQRNILPRTKASLDLGFLFGLSSNAIPAAGWILMYIVDSTRNRATGKPSLYDHVLAEVKEAQNPNGTMNVAVLVNQPILLSTTHEVLRLYVDTLVSRQVDNDMNLPFDRKKKSSVSGHSERTDQSIHPLFVKKGTIMMIPTYYAHTDPSAWQSPNFPHHPVPEVFYPYRFLTSAPGEGSEKPAFTTKHADGMFFPFGGGKTICPGRVFARQEMMAAVAMMLLTFDFEFLGYVDDKGKSTESFPGLRDTFPGSVVMNPTGDMRVRVMRRS